MYFATGGHVPDELAVRREAARMARLATTRAMSCKNCALGKEAS